MASTGSVAIDDLFGLPNRRNLEAMKGHSQAVADRTPGRIAAKKPFYN
jgi:hypothetical protein